MRQIGCAMNGNGDFFGGPVTPPPNPAMTHTREYADFSTGVRPPVQSAGTPVVPIVLIVVGVLVAVAAFAGYRVMMSGTQIELPDELLGLERVDPDSAMAQEVERSYSELETYMGEDFELHVGTYTKDQQLLVVAAAEIGESGAAGQDEFFAGLSEGIASQLPTARFAEEDAGAQGGRMQCVDMPSAGSGTGACAWIADETFGIVVMSSPGTDMADATRSVREAIES